FLRFRGRGGWWWLSPVARVSSLFARVARREPCSISRVVARHTRRVARATFVLREDESLLVRVEPGAAEHRPDDDEPQQQSGKHRAARRLVGRRRWAGAR